MTASPQALTPTTKKALRAENARLRKIAAFLLVEFAEKPSVDLWDDDLDGMAGRLDVEPSPTRRETTRVTYTRPGHTPRAPRPSVAAAPVDDPWAPNPLLNKLDTFRRIVTEHVVRALLDTDGTSGSERARHLTFALQDEGIDLTDAIRDRINDLTLGRNPSDPPF